MGAQHDRRCDDHRFIETQSGPSAHTNGVRVCCLCDHAEVRDRHTGEWIGIAELTSESQPRTLSNPL
jgi:hypothetical protein